MSKDCLSILYNTCVCVSTLIAAQLSPVFSRQSAVFEWVADMRPVFRYFRELIGLIFCVPENQDQQVEIMERHNFVALSKTQSYLNRPQTLLPAPHTQVSKQGLPISW